MNDYPHYSPLGVLVSMYRAFVASVRTALAMLAGLLLGIAPAAGVLLFGAANLLSMSMSMSLAAGGGVLLAGLPRQGAGRD